MEKMEFNRSGNRPLSFQGEIICAQSTDRTDGQGHGHGRYHELKIARTAGGNYVIAVGYRTAWQEEQDYDWAYGGTAADVAAWLRGFDPLTAVMGFPAGEQYREKSARLGRDITLRFRAAAGSLLSKMGEPEEVA